MTNFAKVVHWARQPTSRAGKEAPEQGNKPFNFINIDLATHKNPGHMGHKYSLHIVDVRSNYHCVKFLRAKDEGLNVLKDWVEMITTRQAIGSGLSTLTAAQSWAKHPSLFSTTNSRFGSGRRVSSCSRPHPTPWMNGKVERAAGEVLEKTGSTILAYHFPKRLCTFVMEIVIQVINALPTKANPDLQSPHEMFVTALGMPESARKPYIRHFRAYFCEAYYYIKPQKRVQSDKFAARAEKGRLIGYADLHSKIYWVWNPTTGKIIRATAPSALRGSAGACRPTGNTRCSAPARPHPILYRVWRRGIQ